MQDSKELENIERDSDLYEDYMQASVSNDDINNKVKNITDFCYSINCNLDVSWESLDHTEFLEFHSMSDFVEFISKDKYEQAEMAGKTSSHDWYVTSMNIEICMEFVLDINITNEKKKKIYVNHNIKDKNDFKEISKIFSGSENIKINLTDQETNKYEISSGNYTLIGEEYEKHKISKYNIIENSNMKNYIKNGETFTEMRVKKPKKDDNNSVYILLESDSMDLKFKFEEPEVNEKLKDFVDDLGYGDLMLVEDEIVYVSSMLFDTSNRDPIVSDQHWNVYHEKPNTSEILNNNKSNNKLNRIKRVLHKVISIFN